MIFCIGKFGHFFLLSAISKFFLKFWHGLCVFLSRKILISKKTLVVHCANFRLQTNRRSKVMGCNLKLTSPNFSVYLSKSGTPSTACQLGLLDFERYSSDFSFQVYFSFLLPLISTMHMAESHRKENRKNRPFSLCM
jgi:hypothetical protein